MNNLKDQWSKTMDDLIAFIVERQGQFKHEANCFFYFQMLIQKALNHVNHTVQSFCVEYLFAQNLKLPLFNDLLVDTLIENLNNYRLYE